MEKNFNFQKVMWYYYQKEKKTIFLGLKVWNMLYFVIHIAKKKSVII